MKKDHYAKTTIEVTDRRLRLIAKSADLDKPEEVTKYLANKQAKNSYIESLENAYYRYAKYNKIKWEQPIIKRSSQPPYVPTTEEITALVSDAGKKYSLILNVLKDTGMRPIEIERTKMKWLDLNRGTINVETAKHGNGRTLKLKDCTLAMLKEYIRKNNFGLNDNIFPKVKTMRRVFTTLRTRTANKLKRPEIQKISMYSFRHYFATMLYHKTKDILLVKQQLRARMVIAGWVQGISSCWMGAFNERKLMNSLNLPSDARIVGAIAFGQSNETPKQPPKKEISEIFHFDKWQNK